MIQIGKHEGIDIIIDHKYPAIIRFNRKNLHARVIRVIFARVTIKSDIYEYKTNAYNGKGCY